MSAEVSKFIRYSSQVETLHEAWSFVMSYVDEFEAPSVEINPYWVYGREGVEDGALGFDVVVSG